MRITSMRVSRIHTVLRPFVGILRAVRVRVVPSALRGMPLRTKGRVGRGIAIGRVIERHMRCTVGILPHQAVVVLAAI